MKSGEAALPPLRAGVLCILNTHSEMYFLLLCGGRVLLNQLGKQAIVGPIVPVPEGISSGMRSGRGNGSTRTKPTPMPLPRQKLLRYLTWNRTQAAALGRRRLTT